MSGYSGSEAIAAGDFLGVARSLTGRAWRERSFDSRLALAHAQGRGTSELVGRLLAGRGVGLEEAESFLSPTLRALLPDPSCLRDMDRAVDRLCQAVRAGESLAVFGDYDVDGATSSALLARFFRAVGAPVRVYIPDRISEGYGPNLPALLRLHGEGVRLVVTVDCGATSFEPLAGAAAAGLDVIVIDHHKTEARLPQALAVVNPNRLDEPAAGPLSTLAAVGVAFLLIVGLNRALRQAGWYEGRTEPDLMGWLDLVALGTVCDVVPLIGLNRAFVAQGLKVMARRGNPGIAALADVAGVAERMDAYHAGFVLGPRVNAGGRVGQADLGASILATDDPLMARDLAARLQALNAERRGLEADVVDAAVAQVEDQTGPLILAASAGWHPGVIGIVASRLKERFNRPACVVALADGVGKGSGRSVRGIDLGAAVIAARQAGLLSAGGGHAMAAGFTVAEARLDELQEFLSERIRDQAGEGTQGQLVPTLTLDATIQPAAATTELIDRLASLGPFGTGNSEPRFALTAVRIVRADVVGNHHVRCILTGADGTRLKAIAFRAMDSDLGPSLLATGGRPVHLAGHLRADNWNGQNSVQLQIDDAAYAG